VLIKAYGIHVGKLAGLPKTVVHRAQEILDELEGDTKPIKRAVKSNPQPLVQMTLFAEKSPVLIELAKLEIDSLTSAGSANQTLRITEKVERIKIRPVAG